MSLLSILFKLIYSLGSITVDTTCVSLIDLEVLTKDDNSLNLSALAFNCLNKIDNSDIMARHALAYLKKRNINKYDIVKYGIGYCKEGLYKNMIVVVSIVIPSSGFS